MHMYVLQSLDRDDLLYMSTCHHSRTLSLLPDAPFEFCDRRTVLGISDLKNIYLFFYKSEQLSLEKFNKVFWCLSGSWQWKSGSKW